MRMLGNKKNLLQEHLTKVSSKILSSSFRFNLTPDASEDPLKPVYSIGTTAEELFATKCTNYYLQIFANS